MYLRSFHDNQSQNSRGLHSALHTQHLFSVLQDQIHGFVPAFEFADDFSSTIKLDHYLFGLQLGEFD